MLHIHKRKRDGVYVCGRCGWVIDNQQKPQRATCPVCPTLTRPTYVMVGDLIERGLTAIGITKPFVERITRTAGKPGGCGCARRQRWANEVGIAVQKKANSMLLAAREFYLGK